MKSSEFREVWTFDTSSRAEDLSSGDTMPVTVFLKFIGNMCIRSETRFNYTRESAQSLIEHLNSRQQS